MGSATYGQKTQSQFSTYQEMNFILKRKKFQFYLIKMCDEWEVGSTELSLSTHKCGQ